jgi:phospholipase C
MAGMDRRGFIGMAGAGLAAAAWPDLIDRAQAITPVGGSLQDVDHIVVFMQENRAFDHYFGMFNGVRGFGDPRPLRLASGANAWAQPSAEHPDGHVLPFHGDSKISRSFTVDGAGQSHQDNIGILNRGRFDNWGETGELHKRMLYYTAGDLPFYYALADAFTICDAYHCSTLTQTYPNRLHLFTGCNGGGTVGGDPEMSNYGEDLTPSADMATDQPLRPDAYRWTTYAERLQQAGVSWKVYQEYDNFGDNLLSVFPAFRPCATDSDLYRRGRSWVSEHVEGADRTRSDGDQLVAAFRRDLAAGTLPQVSWIVTAADLSEHPTAEPSKGEHICAGLIAALVDHPEVFARTAFIVNYDEAGGFFDHMPPPVPPVADYRGHSTVPLDGEAKDYDRYTGDDVVRHRGAHPIGLGIRVPAMIVSPWTRGGYVCSELFDHTSVIRFIERRFGVREPNIGPWRRSVCGDLTSAFGFGSPARAPTALSLPDTGDFRERVARSAAGTANAIPAKQMATMQMPGRRPHRATPYRLDVSAVLAPQGRLRILFENSGDVGATFTVYDALGDADPWHFTIGAGDSHAAEEWHAAAIDRYDLIVHGPNGFYRRYAGSLGTAWPDMTLFERRGDGAVELVLTNPTAETMSCTVTLDRAYAAEGSATRRLLAEPRGTARLVWQLGPSDHWYDMTARMEGDPFFLRRFAGRVETGRDGRTDPGIGTMRIGA